MLLNKKPSDPGLQSALLDVDLNLDPKTLKQRVFYDVNNLFEILFAVKGRSCPWLPWCFVMLTTTAFILIDDKYQYTILGEGVMNRDVNPMVHSTFGIVFGFLIVYQSTESSKRWWEARVAWENIITHTREAMRILCAHCNGKDFIKLYGKYLIAFSITSKHYLRRETYTSKQGCPELEKILPTDDINRIYKVANRYRPLACLYAAQRMTEIAIKEGLFSRPIARDINPRFVEMADQLGSCERILYTPMPWVYTLHLRCVLILFLVLTPLGMFNETPLPGVFQIYIFTGILTYAFLGLEDMAVKIQNPFGYNSSHLPLDIFNVVTCRDVKEIINMKYCSFDKTYTQKLYALGKYEIEWKRKHTIDEDEEEGDEGDD